MPGKGQRTTLVPLESIISLGPACTQPDCQALFLFISAAIPAPRHLDPSFVIQVVSSRFFVVWVWVLFLVLADDRQGIYVSRSFTRQKTIISGCIYRSASSERMCLTVVYRCCYTYSHRQRPVACRLVGKCVKVCGCSKKATFLTHLNEASRRGGGWGDGGVTIMLKTNVASGGGVGWGGWGVTIMLKMGIASGGGWGWP